MRIRCICYPEVWITQYVFGYVLFFTKQPLASQRPPTQYLQPVISQNVIPTLMSQQQRSTLITLTASSSTMILSCLNVPERRKLFYGRSTDLILSGNTTTLQKFYNHRPPTNGGKQDLRLEGLSNDSCNSTFEIAS